MPSTLPPRPTPLRLVVLFLLLASAGVTHSHGTHGAKATAPAAAAHVHGPSCSHAGHHHHHDHGHDHGDVHGHGHGDGPDHGAEGHSVWRPEGDAESSPALHALLATLAVSVLPVLVILCIPLLKTDKKTGTTAVNAPLLRGLLAFAVGGLLGDALLHLLPHALAIETPDAVGCYTLGGILAFFALEKVIRGFHRFDGTAARKKDDDHPTAAAASSDSHAAHCHTHEGDAVGGILNLVADFSHNWTDGMALAAAFAAGHRVGLSTALAVFLHEIPHEVGDYALLVQSGMTQRRAMLLQFVTAIGALLGCLVGLVAGDRYEGFEGFVLPFTAGGFLYIALAETVPVLMQGVSLTRTQAIIEALACGAGVGAMVAIGYFE